MGVKSILKFTVHDWMQHLLKVVRDKVGHVMGLTIGFLFQQ
jgi:hypothetical protein